MEIFSSSDMVHLPQSVVSIKSRNGLSASSSNGSTPTIDFEIGASLGFYLAEDVVLSFDFEYTSSSGIVYDLRPQNSGGLGNMIRQVDIYSVQDGVLLESITDYHVLNSALMSHNNGSDMEVQDGNFKKWSLTESYTNDYQYRTPYTSANSHPATPLVLDTAPAYQSQKIQLPIRLSHLLNASQVIPVSALGGLRIRFQLNRPEIFSILSGWDVDGSVLVSDTTPSVAKPFVIDDTNNTISVNGVDATIYPSDPRYASSALVNAVSDAIAEASGTDDITVTYAVVDDVATLTFTNASADTEYTLSGTFVSVFLASETDIVVPTEGDSGADIPAENDGRTTQTIYLSQNGHYVCNPLDLSTCPFKVGQSVKIGDAVVGSAISSISTWDGGLTLELAEAVPILTAVAGTAVTTYIPDTEAIEYSLSNIAMNVPIITPPPQYVKSLAEAIQSPEGMRMDMKTYAVVRSSITKGQTLATLQLPLAVSRAKGLLSIPYIVNTGSFATRYCCDNFGLLNLTKYHYEYMGVRHPERSIDCDKARQGSLSQELIVEQVKAFEYALTKLGSLDGYSDKFKSKTFFLGRNLGVFNSVMDAREANLSLSLESTSDVGGILAGVDGVSSLSVNTYCCSVFSLIMRPQGVVLER